MGVVQDGTRRRPLQKRLEVERRRYVHIENWLMFKSNYEQNMVFIQFKEESHDDESSFNFKTGFIGKVRCTWYTGIH